MANSSVISLKIKTLVEGKEQVGMLTMELGELQKAAQVAQAAVRKMSYSEVVNSCASLGFTMQNLVGSFGASTEGFNRFETSMREANTMAGKAPEDYKRLKGEITKLSKAVPMARDALANGLYQVISNGVPEDNWISYLEASAKSAVGGIADIGEVVKVTSTTIKNYGMDWADAMSIQDKIQLTAKNGVTSFEQLAAALPSVTGQAAQLGVTLDEMLAAMSTLTGVTGNTSEVSTQLSSVLTALTKESSKAQKMAAELGITFNASSIEMAGGFQNFLLLLDDAITKYTERTGELKASVYSKLFGRAEALRLVNALTGELGNKYAENIKEITDKSKGVIDNAFNEIAQTSEAKAQQRINKWSETFDAIGSTAAKIQPKLNFTATLTTTITGFTALGAALRGTLKSILSLRIGTSIISGIGVKVKALSALFVGLGPKIKNAIVSLRLLGSVAIATGSAFRFLMRSTVILAAIGLAIEGVCEIWDHFKKKSDEAKRTVEELNRIQESCAENRKSFEDDAARAAAKERDEIDKLYKIATDETQGKYKRIKAIKDLQSLYPDYFGKISAEKLEVEKLSAAYAQLTEDIMSASRARAAQDQLDNINAELFKIKPQVDAYDDEYAVKSHQYRQAVENSKKAKAEYEAHYVPDADPTDSYTVESGVYQHSKSVSNKYEKTYEEALRQEGIARAEMLQAKKDLDAIKAQEQAYIDEAEYYLEFVEGAPKINRKTPEYTITPTGDGVEVDDDKKKKKDDKVYQVDEIILRERTSLKDYEDAINDLQKTQKTADQETAQRIESVLIPLLKEEKDEFLGISKETEKTKGKSFFSDAEKDKNFVKDSRKVLMGYLAEHSKNLKDLSTAEQYYQDLKEHGDAEQIADAVKMLDLIKKRKTAITEAADAWQKGQDRIEEFKAELTDLGKLSGKVLKVELEGVGFEGFRAKVREIEKLMQTVELTAEQKAQLDELKKAYEDYGRRAVKVPEQLQSGWSGAKGVTKAVEDMREAVKGGGTVWERVTKGVDAAVSTYTSVKQVIEAVTLITKALTVAKAGETAATAVGVTASGAETSAKAANTLAVKSETTAEVANAAAKALSAHAWMPWVGVGIGAAAVAAMVATMAGLPKFAEGGIAYGPTVGLFGEYAGASRNPEVVAPLDKLRSLIEPDDSGVANVRFEIEGDKLVGILDKWQRKHKRL